MKQRGIRLDEARIEPLFVFSGRNFFSIFSARHLHSPTRNRASDRARRKQRRERRKQGEHFTSSGEDSESESGSNSDSSVLPEEDEVVGDPERAVMEEMKEEDEVLSHYSLLTPRNQDFVFCSSSHFLFTQKDSCNPCRQTPQESTPRVMTGTSDPVMICLPFFRPRNRPFSR